ncbi:hypothetical protein CSOJ01_15606 [Colletotrichum sojae]|uniref:Uncharacterized protein n=1 Tax=Colletotrichum sojae TaxID=2175907 RepID=A0A8H6IM25_9PEZI|nr:hypothetical protein CSOJ01_15606 [Colletotrichum sojae]
MSQLSKLAHLTSLALLLCREDLDLCELLAVASLQQLQHVEARKIARNTTYQDSPFERGEAGRIISRAPGNGAARHIAGAAASPKSALPGRGPDEELNAIRRVFSNFRRLTTWNNRGARGDNNGPNLECIKRIL